MEPEVTPSVAASPVTCPSCRSVYNPATRELSADTGLPARIAELEGQLETLRGEYTTLQATAQASAVRVTELEVAIQAGPSKGETFGEWLEGLFA